MIKRFLVIGAALLALMLIVSSLPSSVLAQGGQTIRSIPGIGEISDAIASAGGSGSVNAKLRLLTSQMEAVKTALETLDNAINGNGINISKIGGADPILDDPCVTEAKTTDPVSLAADGVLVAATSAKKNYVCAVVLIGDAAEKVSLWEGTGTACGTSSVALIGSTTEANGMPFVANGGFSSGTGVSSVIVGKTANRDLCLRIAGSARVSGFITWTQR